MQNANSENIAFASDEILKTLELAPRNLKDSVK